MSPIIDKLTATPTVVRLAFSISVLSEATSVSRSLIYEHIRLGLLKATKINNRTDLSPVFHPGMSRVGWSFEPAWLDAATGRGAKPPIARSGPSRCDAELLIVA